MAGQVLPSRRAGGLRARNFHLCHQLRDCKVRTAGEYIQASTLLAPPPPFPRRGVLPHMIEKVRQLCERVMSRIAQDCPELQARTVREDPRYVPVLAEATESLVLSMAYG